VRKNNIFEYTFSFEILSILFLKNNTFEHRLSLKKIKKKYNVEQTFMHIIKKI